MDEKRGGGNRQAGGPGSLACGVESRPHPSVDGDKACRDAAGGLAGGPLVHSRTRASLRFIMAQTRCYPACRMPAHAWYKHQHHDRDRSTVDGKRWMKRGEEETDRQGGVITGREGERGERGEGGKEGGGGREGEAGREGGREGGRGSRGGREGGREGQREGGAVGKGGRQGGREREGEKGGTEGGREAGREGGVEGGNGGREGGRDGGREGGK